MSIRFVSGLLFAGGLWLLGVGAAQALGQPAVAGSDVVIGVGDTAVAISGQTSPNAFVTIRDSDVVIATATADTSGIFYKLISAQRFGIHNLQIAATTPSGEVGDAALLNVNFREHETTEVFAFLPTTIKLASDGDQPVSSSSRAGGTGLWVSGSTLPGALLTLYIDQLTPIEVVDDSNGNWQYRIVSGQLTSGNHSIVASALDSTGRRSAPTVPRFFTVQTGSPNPLDDGAVIDSNTTPVPAVPRQPTISLPRNNSIATVAEVTMVGLSQPDRQIEVWRGGRLIGSVVADDQGGWFLQVRLAVGNNEFTARSCQANGILSLCSPFSEPLIVKYTPLQAAPQLFRTLLSSYRYNIGLHDRLHLNVSNENGQPPYAYAIEWGDGTTQSANLSDTVTTFTHDYVRAGLYAGRLVVTDNSGLERVIYFSVNVRPAAVQESWLPVVVPLLAAAGLLLIVSQAGAVQIAALQAGSGLQRLRLRWPWK